MKLVINCCYGGFNLSHAARMRYAELQGKTVYPEAGKLGTTYWLVPPSEREDRTDFASWPVERRRASNERYAAQTINENFCNRADPLLVQVVEELGIAANGGYAELKIVEIPDGVEYEICEYDGIEHVAEQHRTWG